MMCGRLLGSIVCNRGAKVKFGEFMQGQLDERRHRDERKR